MKEMLFELKEKNLKYDKLGYTTSELGDKINYCVSRVYISGKDGLVFEIEKTLGIKVKIKRFIIEKNGLCFFMNENEIYNSTICIELSPTSSNHKEILQSYLKHNQEITKEQRNILKVYFDKFDYSFSITNL